LHHQNAVSPKVIDHLEVGVYAVLLEQLLGGSHLEVPRVAAQSADVNQPLPVAEQRTIFQGFQKQARLAETYSQRPSLIWKQSSSNHKRLL
jgi:hypothetical protein